jgi:3-deoxy-D-manno-octulosonic-acid transferase
MHFISSFIYSFAWSLALPIVLTRLWLRGNKEQGYRNHIQERLGWYQSITSSPKIWVHAVSAGETRAAEPLIRALLKQYPTHQILLTHMTPIGRTTGEQLFKDIHNRVLQSYAPYDIKWMLRRFLRYFSPSICILIETEVWPNLIAQCKSSGIPVCLVNARLSERSLKKAQRLRYLFESAARSINFVAAQSTPDAQRLQVLGVKELCVTGNMKFDVTPPPQMEEAGGGIRRYCNGRSIFVCGSTREGEEQLIVDAYIKEHSRQNSTLNKNFVLIITPRHPQRFDQVAELLDSYNIKYERRSAINFNDENAKISPETQVILGDSMGEMYMYYAAADLAFVGGSLVALGGHNLIEVCAMSKPAITGQYTFNFSEITEQAITANAAIRVNNADDLINIAKQLLEDVDRRRIMGTNAHHFFMQHQGATQRTMVALAAFIQP